MRQLFNRMNEVHMIGFKEQAVRDEYLVEFSKLQRWVLMPQPHELARVDFTRKLRIQSYVMSKTRDTLLVAICNHNFVVFN